MLALSTFKNSDRAIDAALKKASQCKRLIIVYGYNVNLGLYFMESGVGLYPDLKEQCEKEILADYEQRWKEKVEVIADRARVQGIQVVTYVHAERFTSLCLEVIEKEKPYLIITPRPHTLLLPVFTTITLSKPACLHLLTFPSISDLPVSTSIAMLLCKVSNLCLSAWRAHLRTWIRLTKRTNPRKPDAV